LVPVLGRLPLEAEAAAATREASNTLNILSWETYHDDPWIKQAEKDLGLDINVERVGSVDELFAKARAGTVPWDLYLVDSGSIERYKGAGLISPVDRSKLTNLSHVNPALPFMKFNRIKGKLWAVPYNWGIQPLIYDKTQVPAAERTTWRSLWNPKYEGKVMIPDDAYITLPMVALAWGINPFNWSSADYAAIEKRLKTLRSQIRTLTTSFNDQENMMASGEAAIGYAQTYLFVNKYPKLGMSFPREGTPFWLDNYFFSAHGAANPNVYKFVDYTLKAPWQCRFANETNQNGILPRAVAKQCFTPAVWKGAGGNLVSRMSPAIMKKMVLFQPVEDFDHRLQLWNQFKASY
jgi:spermidine/putrescine transport system substrate-binding protein